MTEYVLLKSTDPKGCALYRDDELLATWDKHEPDEAVASQVALRCGDTDVVERKWSGGAWPYDLPPKKERARREPAAVEPAAEGGDA